MGYSGVKKKQAARTGSGSCWRSFSLAELAKKRPSQVSGGEQQRAAIAPVLLSIIRSC